MEDNNVVIINLDKPRELRLTHKVLKRFMAKYKMKMSDFDEAIDDYDKMTDLIYEMLRGEDPELTAARCDELLDALPIMEIVGKTTDAIKAAFQTGDSASSAGGEGNPTESL